MAKNFEQAQSSEEPFTFLPVLTCSLSSKRGCKTLPTSSVHSSSQFDNFFGTERERVWCDGGITDSCSIFAHKYIINMLIATTTYSPDVLAVLKRKKFMQSAKFTFCHLIVALIK